MKEKVAFVVYKISNGEIFFFIGQRPEGIWLHPTAKIEEGENYTEGAFREIKEELGEVKILNFTDLKQSYSFKNEFGEFRENIVAFEIDEVRKVQEEEFKDYKFLTAEQANKILEHENHKNNISLVEKMLKDHRETKFIIFIAPTACGKSVIIKSLLAEHANLLERVKTFMTRPFKREEDSLLRIQVTHEEFEELDRKGLLIEKNFHDRNWYGSSYKLIEEAYRSGKNLIAEIDINGYSVLKNKFHNIISIFIDAPIEDIASRLKARGGHNEEEMRRRLEVARKEKSRKNECDNIIVNKQGRLEETLKEINDLILSKVS